MMRALVLPSNLLGSHRGFLRALVGGGSLKVLNAVLSLVVAGIMTRHMGAAGYGVYALALSWVSLLAIPSQLGLPLLITRETAQAEVNDRWALLRGLIIRANQFALGVSLLTGAVIGLGLLSGWTFAHPDVSTTLMVGILFLPIVSLGALRSAVLRGLGRVVQGQLPDLVVRPAAFLALTAGAVLFEASLTPHLAMTLHVIAAAMGFGIGVWLLFRETPAQLSAVAPAYDTRSWVRSLLPMSIVMGAQLVSAQIGVLVVGMLVSTEDAGIYRAAIQASLSVLMPVSVVAMVVDPLIAKAFAEGEHGHLQQTVRLSARAVLVLVGSLALMCGFWGSELMAAFYGEEFRSGGNVLALLCLAPFGAALVGTPNSLLSMSHNEDAAARVLIAGVVISAALTLALTLIWGPIGAAAAAVATSVATTFAMSRIAKIRIGVSVSPFGRF